LAHAICTSGSMRPQLLRHMSARLCVIRKWNSGCLLQLQPAIPQNVESNCLRNTAASHTFGHVSCIGGQFWCTMHQRNRHAWPTSCTNQLVLYVLVARPQISHFSGRGHVYAATEAMFTQCFSNIADNTGMSSEIFVSTSTFLTGHHKFKHDTCARTQISCVLFTVC